MRRVGVEEAGLPSMREMDLLGGSPLLQQRYRYHPMVPVREKEPEASAATAFPHNSRPVEHKSTSCT